MADLNTLIQTIVSGVVTGGAGAATTLLTFLRDVRKRVENLETSVGKVGSAVEPRTGLYLALSQMDEYLHTVDASLKKLRKEIDNWDEDPPLWAARLRRVPSAASFGQAEHWNEYENRMENRWKAVVQRISDLEEKVDRLAYDMKKTYVDIEAYEADKERRQHEIRKLQENLKSANGFLKGVMAMLNFQDDETPSDPPPSFSPPPRRSKP